MSACCAETEKPIEMQYEIGTRKGPYSGDPDHPRERTLYGVILGHAQTNMRSIFLTLFAMGQQRCGL